MVWNSVITPVIFLLHCKMQHIHKTYILIKAHHPLPRRWLNSESCISARTFKNREKTWIRNLEHYSKHSRHHHQFNSRINSLIAVFLPSSLSLQSSCYMEILKFRKSIYFWQYFFDFSQTAHCSLVFQYFFPVSVAV